MDIPFRDLSGFRRVRESETAQSNVDPQMTRTCTTRMRDAEALAV
jgi:hypothetical protein